MFSGNRCDTRELWELVKELLNEITAQHYVGSRPPQKSYERATAGLELFAFIPNVIQNWFLTSSACH
jgi:hypothetical protein